MLTALIIGIAIVAALKMLQKKQLAQVVQVDHAEAVFREAYQAHQKEVAKQAAIATIQSVVSNNVAAPTDTPTAAAPAAAPAAGVRRAPARRKR